MGSLALVSQPVWEKENSYAKPAVLCFKKIDFVLKRCGEFGNIYGQTQRKNVTQVFG